MDPLSFFSGAATTALSLVGWFLVKRRAKQNGIYEVIDRGSAASPFVLNRTDLEVFARKYESPQVPTPAYTPEQEAALRDDPQAALIEAGEHERDLLSAARRAAVDAGFAPGTQPAVAIRELDDRLTASSTFGHDTVRELVTLLGANNIVMPDGLARHVRKLGL